MVAYQNILKLTYVDKFLNEIQLRFRDKYKQNIQNKQFNGDFGDFQHDFDSILHECEEEARLSLNATKNPRKYHESEKSTKTMASIMETKKSFLGSLVSSAEPTSVANKSEKNKPVRGVEEESAEVTVAESYGNRASGDENNDIEKKMSELMKSKNIGGRPKKFEKKTAGKAAPTSPQQKKGKENRKWENDVDYKTLDYGSNGSESSAPNDMSNSELAAATQYASVSVV